MSQNGRVELERRPADDVPEEGVARQTHLRQQLETFSGSGAQTYGYGYFSPDESANVREMWRTVRKHRFLIAAIALAGTTLAALHMYRQPNVYEASVLVEIQKDNRTVKGVNGFVVDYVDDKTFINTNILQVTSSELLAKVVKDLKLDAGAPPAAGPSSPDGSLTDAELRRLEPFIGRVRGSLKVQPVRDTRAIRITVTGTDAAETARIANAVAETYVSQNFRIKTSRFTETADWLDRSTRELKARVEQAEQALANYTRERGIYTTGDAKEGGRTITTDRLTALHEQVMRAESDRMVKESLYADVKAGRLEHLPEAYADARVASLQKEKNDLEVELSQLGVKFGPENPRIVEVKQRLSVIEDQIRAGRQALEAKLQNDYERAVRDETALKAKFEKTKLEANSENQDNIQLNILKQDVETARALYTDFLQRYNQAKVEVAEQDNNLRLIEAALVPKGAIGPHREQFIAVAFLLSLAAGIGLAFFLAYIDNTIKTVEDVNKYAQLPALGVIPAIGAEGARRMIGGGQKRRRRRDRAKPVTELDGTEVIGAMVRAQAIDSRSVVAEAYRGVRTSVLLSSADEPPKTMLVTSAHPGEGKSTTAINTAISLAQLGASVLLIDCDLRKPTAHKIFGLSNTLGVSTYLSSKADLTSLVQKTDVPNLWLLPSGAIPPNPAELVSSLKMRKMLQALAGIYDHIIVDSPPTMHVTDPVILSTMVDGTIIVVHGGKSTRDSVKRVRTEIANVGSRIFGVVLNNVDIRKDGYDYYYYRYYSEYTQESSRS